VLEVELVRLVDLGHVELDAEAGTLGHLDEAARICSGSVVSRWPSCQIQCVSIAVTRPARRRRRA
jgi:hypothetical protein